MKELISMTKDNQNIKCKVFNCNFNNNTLKRCELNEIEINCDCDNDKYVTVIKKEDRFSPIFFLFFQ